MLIEKKSGRSRNEDRSLAIILAGCAGILNALALGAFGLFPSNMTGNATQLTTEIVQWDKIQMLVLILILVCFLLGAFTARVCISLAQKLRIRTIYAHILLVEGLVLIFPVLLSHWISFSWDKTWFLSLLSYLMGVHNSTSTQLSRGKVRTTHITGTLTDIGIALASLLLQPILQQSIEQTNAAKFLLSIHFTAIFSFLAGGALGIMAFDILSMKAFAVAGSILILVAGYCIMSTVRKKRRYLSLI